MATTLKEKAYDHLRKMIITGEIQSGQFLTERSLVETLQMSRTPIRSALERLEVEGLVNYTPNKGLVVAELSIDRAVDVYDFRKAIESYVVQKLSARTWLNNDVQTIEDNLRQQESCADQNDIREFTVLDAQFHRQLAVIYGNKEILQTMDQLQDKLCQIAIRVLRKDPSRIKVSLQDHQRIFKWISEGNGQQASEEMIQHLEFGKQILIL